MKLCSPQKQVQYFLRASSFWSRRCFCSCSGLWLTFIGLTTVSYWRWACTHTSTRCSHTSHSSADSTLCWTRKTLSHCRTSSQLWDSKPERKGPNFTFSPHTYLFVTAGCLSKDVESADRVPVVYSYYQLMCHCLKLLLHVCVCF